MTELPSESKWPDYLPLPREDIFAIGVIALAYGQLESIFKVMLATVARWNDMQVAAIFHRLNNNQRFDVVSELLAKTTIPSEVKAKVEHFLAGLGICTENRNFIMHSFSGGMFTDQQAGTRGVVLEKYSKPGNKQACYLVSDDLRKIADDIHRYSLFGSVVVTDLTNYATHLQSGHPENFRLLPATLHGTPPLPEKLSWKTPADPTTHGIPPAALPLLSAHRHQKI
jgi:hypothetical protein